MIDFTPTNEQGVVFLFACLLNTQSEIELVKIGAEFPDAVISVAGQRYATEFEYKASNFILHDHDVRECDLVVCWENDMSYADFPLPIVDLQTATPLNLEVLQTPTRDQRNAFYWKTRCLRAERELTKTKAMLNELEESCAEGSSSKNRPTSCPYCEAVFSSSQGVSAHLRWCDAYEAHKAQESEQ